MKMTLIMFLSLTLVAQAQGPDEESRVLKSRGYELMELHQHEEALGVFHRYLEKNPTDERIWLEYAGLFSSLKRHEESAKVYEEVVGRRPLHDIARFKLGCEYLNLKRYDDAKSAFSALTSSKNLDIQTRANMALETLRDQALATSKVDEEGPIFVMVKRRKNHEILERIAELETRTEISWALQAERLYALQRLGQFEAALKFAENMRPPPGKENDFKLLHAQLLSQNGRYKEAFAILYQVVHDKNDKPAADRAASQRRDLPGAKDPDRWAWGEFYSSGDYFGRLGTVIGTGSIKQGTYIPGARWIQPYAEFTYTNDSRSEPKRSEKELGSIFSENLVDLNLGVRVVPLPNENFQIYVSGGAERDLLAIRHGGNWYPGFRAGINGFQAWGAGSYLRDEAGEEIAAPADSQSTMPLPETIIVPEEKRRLTTLMWRHDLFAELGGDFSFYRRLSNCICYAQGREGIRVAQFGTVGVWDFYALQNVAFDTRGNFFDNLGEIGPGTRWIFSPWRSWQIVMRVESVNGFYYGRNDLMTRGGHIGDYQDFRVGLTLSTRW